VLFRELIMFVCLCHGVTDTQIKNAVKTQGVGNLRELKKALGVGSQCGSCIETAQDIIDMTIVDYSLFKDVG
jgi:bacterioferritin-associated ferredoxin